MYQFIPRRSGIARLFTACLLAYSLLLTPLASLAASRQESVPLKEPAAHTPSKSQPATAANSSASSTSVTNAMLLPTITASKTDSLFTDVDVDTQADPGDTLEYTVTIQNSVDPANNVVFTDTIDAHTTLVPGSVNSSPIAFDDAAYTATGNVRISVNAASGVLTNDIDPDTGTNTGLTASAGPTSANNGNVVMNANGSFTYNPAPGFTGTDTFTYTVTDATGATGTGTVTFTVTGVIWFVNAAAAGGGDGRLTSPFNCLVGAGCYSGSANDPGDNIFLYSGAYTGGLTLKANQRFIGQGATAPLVGVGSLTGLTPPTGSDPLPSTGGANPTITTVAAATTALTLASGNLLRGFTIGNTTNSDIAGTSFGELNIGEVTLNGTGRALDLNTGSFAAGSGITSITVTSSTAQGILIQSVSGANALTIGSTSIASTTSQGIHVTGSAAPISFGNTAIGNAGAGTGGTVGLSLQNSSGARSFGTLSIQNSTQQALVHAVGGGPLTVAGLTTITNPTLGGIDIQDSTTAISFANVNVTGSGGTGVFVDDSTGSISFGDLDINPDGGQRGLHVTDHTTGTISTSAGNITTTTQTAVEIVGTGPIPLSMTLNLVSVNGAPSGIVISNNSGSFLVTGDGSTTGGILDRDGSGGVLANTTSDAVRLTGANNITLKQMNLTSPGDTTFAAILDNETATGEHGVEAIGGSNIILSGILIDSPSSSGMIALNLTGTNRLNDNSLVTNIDNPATHALYITNGSGFNLTLFEVNNTDFTNSSSGASNINFKNSGTANMTVEIRNGCIFEALGNQAITADAGSNGATTGTVTSLITGNTFQNAVVSEPSPGVFVTSENNVAALVTLGATHNSTISNNTFSNIAEDGRVANTSIIRTQNAGGKLTSVVENNTIQNIGYQSGAGGRHVIGHVFEPAAFSAGNFSNLRFSGNSATNITYTATNREFVFINYRDFANGGDVKVNGNTWNMPTQAATSEAVELTFEQVTAGQVVDVEVDGNNGTGSHNTRFVNVDVEGLAIANLTITDNTFTNNGAAAGQTLDIATEDNGGAGDASACVNVANNILSPNSITLNEGTNTTMTVTQASSAAVAAANGGAAVTVTGGVAFGGPVCALPTNALLTPSSGLPNQALATVTAQKDLSSVVATVSAAELVKAPATNPVQNSTRSSIRRHLHHAISKVKRFAEATVRTNLAPMFLAGETVTVNGSGGGFTLPAGKSTTIKFRVTVNNPPNLTLLNPARVSNQGTVSGSNFASVLTDDPAVGGANDPTETLIDLFDSQTSVITSDSNIVQGESVTFTATVTPVSAGPTPVTGTVDFFDGAAIPANLIAGCDDRPLTGDPAQATCTTTALTAAGSPHTITARYNADGGNYDQSSGTVSQTVILVPDLTIDKSHTGTFFQGQAGATYTITVTNSGNGAMPTGQTISVTDTLPDGLTATAMIGTGWTCQPTAPPNTFPVSGPTTLSCARTGDTALASLASYPAITLTVNVDNDAPTGAAAVTNSVSVTQGAGGEVNTGNNSDTDPTDINAGVDLTIDKSHTDIFTQGDTGKTYTITVTNSGGTASSGTVTVTDTLPTGLTPTAPNGAHNGWTCTIVGQDLSCTRGDALSPTTSYPDITLTVDVANNAPTSVDNTATVANAGDVNGTNNSDTDQTTINQLCVTPPADMVAWWTGDDTTRDIAGGNDGTLNGNAGYAAGKVLNGFNLDGTGDFVQAPDSNSLDLTTAITIDAWINPTVATPTARIVDKMTAGGSDGYALDLVNGNLRLIVGSNTALSTGVVPNGILTHVAATYDGANVVFYIDGVAEPAVPTTGAIPVNALPLRIGADQAGTLAFQGVIDEVEIFSTAVAAADILAIFNSAAGGKCKPADLTISKTHTDPFQQGSTGNTYTITVHNDGPGDTVGTTTVTDSLPAGLTATAMTGTGWTCAPTAPPNTFPVAGATTIACTSTDVVASGADFPVITLTVDVGANTPSVTNTVTVANAAEMDASDNSDSDLTNLNAQADLQIVSKTELADPVIASQDITYSISFINNGPSDASTVTVTDAVPAGTTFVSASVTTGTGWTPSTPAFGGTGNVIFSKGTVAVGETATFSVVVRTAANTVEGTVINNTATAASATADPTANNSATAMTTVNQSDVEITSKTDTPDPVNAGANITYTVDFKNNSAVNSASTVTVTDAVPTGTTFVSATTPAGWTPSTPAVGGTGNVVFSRSTVAAAETAQFTIVVKVDANVASGTIISNTATAATASIDNDTPNNSKTATTTVATDADLEINSKSDSPDPVTAGQNITYTINFTNNGPSDASTVTVTDGVPSGTTFVSAAVTASSSAGWSRTDSVSVGGTGNIVFSNSSVPAGATATFEIVVKVNSNVTTQISNTATAAATTADSDSANNAKTQTTNTQASADIELTSKTDSPDPVVISTNLTYTINFVNNGPSDAATVTVSDPLPAGTTLVSATTGDAGWSRTDVVAAGTNGTIIFSNASVPAGATATFTIVVAIDSGVADGTILNNTATAASVTDSTAGNNSASASTTVTTTLALIVNQTTDQADANVGDRICDVDTGTAGDQCTLRAAIEETNAAATADSIGFSLPADSTIELTSALPAIAGDLEINGPANSLTVDGNNTGRVLSVTSGTVSINTFTVTGGSVTGGHGAGLLVTGGDVTVKDMLFTANKVVNGNGGAIAVTSGLLTILNSTISGNTATNGGGVSNGGGGLTMVNVTVTNNTADGDVGSGPVATGDGGGILVGANPTLIRNTIIAGNTATTNANVSGTIPLGGNNLLSGDPLLAALADNGGPTMTHALLAGSPALDAGADAHATAASLTNDQRGAGFNRFADGPDGDATPTVDIGAFEAQVWVEDIADRSIAEGGSDSFNFSVGGLAAPTTVTATSSDPTVVPNLPANLNVTGAGGTRTLDIIPPTDAFGTTTITVTVNSASGSMTDTFLFTITPVNDPPTFTGGPNQIVNEDAGAQTVPNWATGISAGPANESGQVLTVLISNNNNALFSVQPAVALNGTLTYTPAPNATGVATVFVAIQDDGGGNDQFPIPPYQFTITVTALNDAPQLDNTGNMTLAAINEDIAPASNTGTLVSAIIASAGGDRITDADAGALEGIAVVGVNNANGTWEFSTNNGASWTPFGSPSGSVARLLASNATTRVRFLPNANFNGTVDPGITFRAWDQTSGVNGGTGNTSLNGGSTAFSTPAETASITVNAVNDAPTANAQNVNTNEDTPLGITLTGTDVETTSANLVFNVTVQPTNGVLSGTGANRTYTPNANYNGPDSFKFTVTDTGDGSSPALTSAEATVSITVNAVNDGPVNTVPGAQTVVENSTLTFSAGNGNQISVADADAGASGVRVTLTATNGTVTLAGTGGLAFTVGDGTADPTMTFSGTVANINAALNGLVFTPTNGFNGAASLQIVTNDLGNTGSGGALSDTDTINITVNDGGALQFSSATYSVNENGGTATITVNRTGGTAGTTTVDFATSNGTATAGVGADYLTSTGTLTFGPGVTSQTFNVTINEDPNNETPETINLTLSNVTGSGALGTPSTAVLTIVDNDPGGALQFSSATYSVSESGGSIIITVNRVGGSTGTTFVDFATSNGTATAGSDYTTTTGTLTFNNGVTSQTFTVPILADTVDEPNETVNLTLSNVTGTGNLGTPSTAVLTITDNDPPTFALDASSYTVDEDDLRATITVNRGGDLSQAVKVNYATSDSSGLNACSQVTGNASQRCDYATVVGTLRFAAGESSKLIHIPIVDDVYVDGTETFTITLSTPTGGELATPATATVTINDNDVGAAANPIDNNAFWLRQMYIDILGREPEPGAINAWLAILNNCTPATNCDRTAVALGFLKSVEFQGRGFFAYRFYEASLGRPALYSEFVPDHARFSGFLSPADLELNKQDYVNDFMNRAEFKAIYDPTIGNNTLYVDTLLQRAGLPNHPQRTAWINGLNAATLTRADVLRQLVDSNEVYFRFLNEGFVVMNYFGLLRRSADAQYLVWLQLLNQNGDERAIVSGFINSQEYRLRFGPN